MDFKDLDPELRAKGMACSTPEEIMNLAKTEGYLLTDDDLDKISGGSLWDDLWEIPSCPSCGSDRVEYGQRGEYSTKYYHCLDCGREF